jgi:imidazolonepropionase-like amidohydrolase
MTPAGRHDTSRATLLVADEQFLMYALTGGTVVDADGVRSADVGIEDGRIVAVGAVDSPDEERDVSGQVIVPGLVDAHVHLMLDGRPDIATITAESAALRSYRATAAMSRALDAGVTTVRDLGARDRIALEAARAVDEGVLDGPRVVAAGRAVVMTGGHGHQFGREADGPVAVRKAAREQLKAGAGVLKCMATGGVLTEGADTGGVELTTDEIRELTAAASAAGVPTAAHAHAAEGIDNAVRAGISSIEHGTHMDEAAAERMADTGTVWVPTASALHGIVDNGVDAGIPAEAVEKAEAALDAYGDAWDHALAHGVRIAMGTDAGTPFNHHGRAALDELAYMHEYGLSLEDVLRAATVDAAALLGLDDVGLIREGYAADLLVLDDDPLDDVDAWREPEHVIRDGRIVR